MPKLNRRGLFSHGLGNQQGVVAPLLILLLLIAGLIAGVYLIQNRTNLLPRASVSSPLTPQTSLTFSPSTYQINVGQEVNIKILVRSDISAANLFTAKISYDPTLLQLGRVDTTSPFIKNWVEQSWSDLGKISLIGGVPNPGFQTQVGDIAPMATLYFTALKTGTATISFDDASAIYSNADNLNILAIKDPVNIAIVSGGPAPVPSGSRVFVTSTFYNGNLGGLVGADAKCQARADAANLGGTWKAWLSDNTISAASRLIHNTAGYKLINGAVVANSWDTLVAGSLTNPINVTELNATLNVSWVWTNSTANGSIRQATDSSCNNWTTGTSGGGTGDSSRNDSGWTDFGASSCINVRPLYCFEQSSPSSTCIPRPACLDAQPPCMLAVPLNGNWCPACTPRPACLDARPACEMPEPAGGWCSNQVCEHAAPPVGCQYEGEDIFPVCAAKLVCASPVASVVPSATPIPGSGDGNKDGKVDLIDLSILLSDYNKNSGFRTAIDLNGDGAVNSFDFSLMRNLLISKGVIKG